MLGTLIIFISTYYLLNLLKEEPEVSKFTKVVFLLVWVVINCLVVYTYAEMSGITNLPINGV